jgi:hypothetical protein
MSERGVRLLHLALIVPLIVAGLLIVRADRGVRPDPAGVLAALRAATGPALPSAAAVGATSRSETTSFDRDTLYTFNDGAAEAFLARGFERCVTADFVFGAGPNTIDVSAEAHRFHGIDGCAEQAAAEHPSDARPVVSLPGAVGDAQVLVLTRGRDLLKLVAGSEQGGARDAMVRIARAWSRGS